MGRGGGGSGFSEEDRKKLNDVLDKVNNFSDEFGSVKNILIKAIDVIDNQAKHICFLNSELNRVNYRIDAQNQYGRKECLQVDGLDESVHGSDAEKIMFDIVDEIEDKAKGKQGEDIKINMKADHIQRCHFLGGGKRKLICKFIPYKIRMKILLNKKVINGARSGKYKNVFISENLTPMRSRLLWYMKKKCSTKFTKLHSRDGVIKTKIEGSDSQDDPWINVRTPDDLFPHLSDDEDFDFNLFNTNLHGIQILPDMPDHESLKSIVNFNSE